MNNREKTYLNHKKKIENMLLQMPKQWSDIYHQLLQETLNSYSINTYNGKVLMYVDMMKNVDPTNLKEDYILANILKYQTPAWNLYLLLYKNKILGSEYRFLNSIGNYGLIKEIVEQNLSVKNILCCKYGKTDNRYIVTTTNQKITHMVESFFDSKHTSRFSPLFPEYVTSALFVNNIDNYNKITDSFIESLILNAPSEVCAHVCRLFLIFCLSNIQEENNRKYSSVILSNQKFVTNLLNGFKLTLYNKFEHVPEYDKWLLLPNGDENRSTQMTSDSYLTLDFTIVANQQMKQFIKDWFWLSNSALITKSKEVHKIIDFVNMFYPEEKVILNIEQSICANYKSFVLSKWNRTETRSSRIYPVLSFIRYLDDYTEINVDKGCYLYLTNRGTLNKKGAIGVKKEELELIAAYINDHKNDSHNHLCLYVMFHIAINTEFRISQIVTLTTDCVKESMKSGEYVIQSNIKQSEYEVIDQPCARIVKDIIFSYLNATDSFREKLQPSLRKYLFIKEDGNCKALRPFSRTTFSDYLGNVCQKLNIPRYTAKNLRITYITNAKEYAMKNGLSDLTLLKVTNHANVNTINNHYIQESIRDALQATIGVVIGDVRVDGTISANEQEYDTSKEVMVANGCGYCQSAACTKQGPSPCQRCTHFFTTIKNIPYYKKEINRLKNLNDGTKNPHDAEDLIKLIRLNTYILEKLIELKGEKQNGTLC